MRTCAVYQNGVPEKHILRLSGYKYSGGSNSAQEDKWQIAFGQVRLMFRSKVHTQSHCDADDGYNHKPPAYTFAVRTFPYLEATAAKLQEKTDPGVE
ncbi:hypothetical protein MferCBS31731_005587 [Microsporum ferrugineum]